MNTQEELKDRITKSFQDQLDQEELQGMVEWMEADPTHLIYYNEMKERYEREQVLNSLKDGTAETQYVRFTNSVKKTRLLKKIAPHWFYKAAAALLIVGIGVLALLLALPDIRNTNRDVAILPEKPYIITSEGEKVVLEEPSASIRFDQIVKEKPHKNKAPEKAGIELSYNELIVPRGYRITIELSDGSTVWLNSESRLQYPQEFAREERKVKLIGEGYFRVTSLSQSPFIVETKSLSVKVHGTQFNVSAFPGDNHVTTTLVSGSVSLFSDHMEEEKLLVPSERGVFNTNNHSLLIEKVDTESDVSWINGYYSFSSESLQSVITKLTRSYGVPISLEDPELNGLKFSGKLDLKEKLTDVLEVIRLVAPIQYVIFDHQIIIQKLEE